MSPQTQRPQLMAASSLDNNTPSNNDQDLDFNKSTKKLDKIVEKINIINAVKGNHEQKETTNSPEPQVIYLDSSNSPNGADYTQPSQSEQAPNGDKLHCGISTTKYVKQGPATKAPPSRNTEEPSQLTDLQHAPIIAPTRHYFRPRRG